MDIFGIIRAKWKKRKKTNNAFRNASSLLPTHNLQMSPFGSINSSADSLCTFGSASTEPRWPLTTTVGMNQMSQHSLSTIGHQLATRQSSSFGGNASAGSTSGALNCNPNTISPHGSSYAVAPYTSNVSNSNPMNISPPTPNQAEASPTSQSCSPQTSTGWLCSNSDNSAWRGSTIVSLRRKALEHSVMTIR